MHAPYLSADWSTDVLGTIKRGELFKDTNLSMCFDRVSHCSQIYVRNWHKRSALQLLPLGRRLAMMLVATISVLISFLPCYSVPLFPVFYTFLIEVINKLRLKLCQAQV